MYLSVLTDKLLIDSGVTGLGWNTLQRAFERAVAQINKDLGAAYEITGSTQLDAAITPDPTSIHQELMLILAYRFLVWIERLSASDAVSWKSGDKSVDRTRKALSKTELCRDLWEEYLQLAGLDKETAVVGGQYESTGGDVDYTSDRQTWMT